MTKESDYFGRLAVWVGLAVALVVGLMTAPVDGVRAQGPGVKQTEKLADKANDTVGSIRAAKLQIKDTLVAYNLLVGNKVEDPKKTYKDLQKGIEDTDKKVAEVDKKVAAMQKEADILFADWSSNLANISSEDLRKRSEERMNDTRDRYNGILAAGDKAGAVFNPFIASLKDQVVYLGHDLNPSALASLQPDADKLNKEAEVLFKKIDETVDEASGYITSLTPQS